MDVRKHLESRKKMELAKALQRLAREEKRLVEMHLKSEEWRRQRAERYTQRIDLRDEETEWNRFCGLMEEIRRQTDAVRHSQESVARERRELVARKKDRRILDNLRKRGLVRHMREWVRGERCEQDETGRDIYLRGRCHEKRQSADGT